MDSVIAFGVFTEYLEVLLYPVDDENEEKVRASRIGDEASWKCAIAKRRESLRMECRGWQRRCRYVEKWRYRKKREREEERG